MFEVIILRNLLHNFYFITVVHLAMIRRNYIRERERVREGKGGMEGFELRWN